MVKAALVLAAALGSTHQPCYQATATGAGPVTKPFDHVHVAVTEPERAADWYVRLLGARAAAADRVWFGEVLLIFQKSAERRSGASGRVGHVAFASPDVAASVASLKAGGARQLANEVTATAALANRVLLEDPWGVPIEIVEASRTGLHHIHLIARDPAAALQAYERLFGGARTHVGENDGVAYGDVLLLVESGQPTEGATAIDHISWRVEDVVEATEALRKEGVPVLVEPGTSPGGNRVSFVEGPGGVKIEVMQRRR